MSAVSDDRRSGAALLVVLLFAVVIANLALVALRASSSEIRASAIFVDDARADALGQSVVALTRYYISDDVEGRGRGGSFTARFDSASVTVDYLSESARIDINHSPVDLLETALLSNGISQDRVDAIAREIVRRRSTPPVHLYESQFEVADDWKLSNAEAKRIVPLLTIANSDGMIDPLLAQLPILSILFGGEDERVAQFSEKRMIGFPDSETALSYFSELTKKWLEIGSNKPVRALASVITKRGLRRSFEAVFDLQPAGDNANIYYWRPLD
jgi:hypothetical protein